MAKNEFRPRAREGARPSTHRALPLVFSFSSWDGRGEKCGYDGRQIPVILEDVAGAVFAEQSRMVSAADADKGIAQLSRGGEVPDPITHQDGALECGLREGLPGAIDGRSNDVGAGQMVIT